MDKWYICTVEYYSTPKREEILTNYKMNELEDIMLNKMSVAKRQILYELIYKRYLEWIQKDRHRN